MTIKELIQILQQIEDQEAMVMVTGYEGGVDDIEDTIPTIVNVALDVNNKWWDGSHEVVSEDHTYTDKEIVKAIVLR
jgi:hypothetical protein